MIAPCRHKVCRIPIQALATDGGATAARTVIHNNLFYDRNAIISNRSDDEQILAAARRNPSAFRALRGL